MYAVCLDVFIETEMDKTNMVRNLFAIMVGEDSCDGRVSRVSCRERT